MSYKLATEAYFSMTFIPLNPKSPLAVLHYEAAGQPARSFFRLATTPIFYCVLMPHRSAQTPWDVTRNASDGSVGWMSPPSSTLTNPIAR